MKIVHIKKFPLKKLKMTIRKKIEKKEGKNRKLIHTATGELM